MVYVNAVVPQESSSNIWVFPGSTAPTSDGIKKFSPFIKTEYYMLFGIFGIDVLFVCQNAWYLTEKQTVWQRQSNGTDTVDESGKNQVLLGRGQV